MSSHRLEGKSLFKSINGIFVLIKLNRLRNCLGFISSFTFGPISTMLLVECQLYIIENKNILIEY